MRIEDYTLIKSLQIPDEIKGVLKNCLVNRAMNEEMLNPNVKAQLYQGSFNSGNSVNLFDPNKNSNNIFSAPSVGSKKFMLSSFLKNNLKHDQHIKNINLIFKDINQNFINNNNNPAQNMSLFQQSPVTTNMTNYFSQPTHNPNVVHTSFIRQFFFFFLRFKINLFILFI